jgi:hypothetical protein
MVPDPRLEEPDDFARFNVIAPADMSDHEIDQALRSSQAGHVAEGAAHVSIEWLASVAPEPRSAAWRSGLAAMLGYAKEKGWLTASQKHVQAHIERAEP